MKTLLVAIITLSAVTIAFFGGFRLGEVAGSTATALKDIPKTYEPAFAATRTIELGRGLKALADSDMTGVRTAMAYSMREPLKRTLESIASTPPKTLLPALCESRDIWPTVIDQIEKRKVDAYRFVPIAEIAADVKVLKGHLDAGC